ncbi:MAG: Flp family type IVb pilin [Acidimicrobiia bacterium]|nr:Flp family type IVb pilin [Acidimicrobiia bacterium]NNF63935.1 Flp family type IVb pilin [Acidimicrobiia bacterium]
MWTELQSRLVRDEEGASLVEYALLVALIAVIAIGAVTLVGNNVSGELNSVGNAISTP